MNLRKLGVVFVATVASLAIVASSASARELFEASSSAWYIGPAPGTKLTGTKVVRTTVDPETTLSFSTTIAGSKLTLDATGVNCVSCKAENSGGLALVKGELEFTGLTLVGSGLSGCSAGKTLKTKPLTATMGSVGATGRAPIRFAPTTGESPFVIEIVGATCPIGGTYKVIGVFYGEAANATEKFSKEQTFSFSQAIQEELGSATSLKVSSNPVFLTGTVSKSLEPQVEFAVKPK